MSLTGVPTKEAESKGDRLLFNRLVRSLLIGFCLASMFSCSSELFPKRIVVEQQAINEIRNITPILAEATSDIIYDGTTTVMQVLIVGTDRNKSESGLGEVLQAFEKNGWEVFGGRDASRIDMRSGRWSDVHVAIEAVEHYSFDATTDPQIGEAISQARKIAESRELIVIEVSPSG